MKKEEELRQKWITGRTVIISEMLDNPNEHEIYPTSKCFTKLDDLHNELLEQYATEVSREVAIEFAEYLFSIVDSGGDLLRVPYSFDEYYDKWLKEQEEQ